ncbi:glycoside hydrolase family 13 protein [Selenomonas ruminis]|uniref:Alpha-glucosidase n=1 Tax=Selenomonas ruminis TaxID=2593411 RepID=A0A5D6WAR9_9FIRM|nr:alpha-glucosidase [Selenomonas sp. mPRGC5]TYZ25016.1 alpha-glucosidase [Selenomonas sp. mPRGC5]
MSPEKHAWWKEAVIYQIYPRSFADSNGDGIGDLNGITEHLDYLAKLGIDVIWLSPVYESPNDDNGYDISDYRNIMAEFGTMEDFDRLLAEAHRRNIRIVMDLVVNHTSDEHPWFIESRKGKDNPFRDYYIWKDPGVNGEAPNHWESCFSGSAWQYDDLTGQYYLHCFSRKQPDLNWENPKVREEVFDLMDWWCQKGIDGFRMDVISMISKDQSFPEGPLNADGYSDMFSYVCNGPRVHEYLQEMNRRVLSRYDLLTVGETAGVTVEEAKKYANSEGTELGMVFHFEHTDGAANSDAVFGKWTYTPPKLAYVRKILNKWQLELEGKAWGSLYWDNHDQPRVVSRFGNDSEKWRVKSAKMLATVLHLQKGTPYIYQGEEIGMTNRHFSSVDDCADIEEKNAWQQLVVEQKLIDGKTLLKCFDCVARDNARTPMQWDDTPNAGFTTGKPWLAVNPNYTGINVEQALADKESVFYYYQRLIELRHTLPIIVYGRFKPLLEDSEEIYAYQRLMDGQVLTVAANWTDREAACPLFAADSCEELISNYDVHKEGFLQPYEARVVWEARR